MTPTRLEVHTARCPDSNGATYAPLILGCFVLLLAFGLAFDWTPALAAERFELRGSHVAIFDLAGEVELVATGGSAVVVHVTRGGKDADRLDIATGRIRDVETLRVRYPSRRVHYRGARAWGWNSSTSVRVGEDGRFGDSDHSTYTNRHKVMVSGGSGLDAHADMRIEVPKGQKLDLYLAVGQATASNIDGEVRLDVAAADVHTQSTRGGLVIDVGSGAVTVNDAEGDVNIDTGSGSVEMMKIRGDQLLVDTGSGGVSGADITARRVSVDTGSGSVDLGALRASNISVDTGSGRVQLDLRSDIESLHIDTGSGGITVRLPETVGAELDIQSSSGGIRSELPIEVRRRDHDSLRGRIGDGHGSITIETGSGGVRLLKG